MFLLKDFNNNCYIYIYQNSQNPHAYSNIIRIYFFNNFSCDRKGFPGQTGDSFRNYSLIPLCVLLRVYWGNIWWCGNTTKFRVGSLFRSESGLHSRRLVAFVFINDHRYWLSCFCLHLNLS